MPGYVHPSITHWAHQIVDASPFVHDRTQATEAIAAEVARSLRNCLVTFYDTPWATSEKEKGHYYYLASSCLESWLAGRLTFAPPPQPPGTILPNVSDSTGELAEVIDGGESLRVHFELQDSTLAKSATAYPYLRNLSLAATWDESTSLSPLEKLPNLWRLRITRMPSLTDVSVLKDLPFLRIVDLMEVPIDISQLRSIRLGALALHLYASKKNSMLAQLQTLEGLSTVLGSFSARRMMPPALRTLSVFESNLKDLDGIESMPTLEYLNLRHSRFPENMKHLQLPPSMRFLAISQTTAASDRVVISFGSALRTLDAWQTAPTIVLDQCPAGSQLEFIDITHSPHLLPWLEETAKIATQLRKVSGPIGTRHALRARNDIEIEEFQPTSFS
jgi:hypothetical protein